MLHCATGVWNCTAECLETQTCKAPAPKSSLGWLQCGIQRGTGTGGKKKGQGLDLKDKGKQTETGESEGPAFKYAILIGFSHSPSSESFSLQIAK